MTPRWGQLALWLSFAGFAGCGTGPSGPSADADRDENRKKSDAEITAAFTDLKAAVKAEDADKIWELLDRGTQDDAEAEAKRVRQLYAGLADKDKGPLEKALDLPGAELTELSGKRYLKTMPVYVWCNHHVADGKLDRIEVTAPQTAIVQVRQPDGGRTKLDAIRYGQEGKWKFMLKLPKAPPGK